MGDGGEPGGWLTKVLVLVVMMVLAAKRKLVWPWANGGCDRRERTNERVLLMVSPFAAIVTRIWLNTAGLADLKVAVVGWCTRAANVRSLKLCLAETSIARRPEWSSTSLALLGSCLN